MVDNNVLNKQKELVQVLFKKASGDQSGAGTSSSSSGGTSSTPTTTVNSGSSTPFGDIPRRPFEDEPTPGKPVGPFGHPMIGAGSGTQTGSGTGTGTQRPVSTGFNPTGYRFGGENIYQPEADHNVPNRGNMSPMSESKTSWIDSLLNTLSENKFAVGGGLGGALLGALAGGENKLLWSLLLGGLGAGAGYMFDRD